MTIKEKKTTRGGNIGYKSVRSKFIKGKDGFGAVITEARENLIAADPEHKDPGVNVVAAHIKPGAHHGTEQAAKWETRAWNTAESNMRKDGKLSASEKIKLKKIKSRK